MTNNLRYTDQIMAIIRIVFGGMLIYMSREMLIKETMTGNIQWLTDIHFPIPTIMAYIGKIAELLCGVSLVLGFGIRWTALPVMFTMLVINYFMENVNLWGNTFLAFLLLMVFFAQGDGIWTVISILNKSKMKRENENQ